MELEQERVIKEFSKESFMQEVQKYPVLYDKFDTDFKNSIIKKNAWTAIGVLFGLTDQECESKYKNIRSAYGRFLRKKKSTPSGSGRIFISKEYDFLQWLNIYIDHRDTTTNVGDKAITTESPMSCISYETNDEEVSNQAEVENENLSENTSELNFSSNTHKSNTFSNQQKSLNEIKSPINKRKKQFKRSPSDENTKIQDAILSTMNNINATLGGSAHEESDDITHFCKSICATIKRLPPKTQAVAKVKIQEYLAALEFPDIVN